MAVSMLLLVTLQCSCCCCCSGIYQCQLLQACWYAACVFDAKSLPLFSNPCSPVWDFNQPHFLQKDLPTRLRLSGLPGGACWPDRQLPVHHAVHHWLAGWFEISAGGEARQPAAVHFSKSTIQGVGGVLQVDVLPPGIRHHFATHSGYLLHCWTCAGSWPWCSKCRLNACL